MSAVRGWSDPALASVVEGLEASLDNDGDYSFQAVAYLDGRAVLDVWGGPHLGEESVIVPYSVTKIVIGIVVGLLLQQEQLNLDERVCEYWPEFGQAGKADVTVRQLLSHQAGLPQSAPPLAWSEMLNDHTAAERLASSPAIWHPGSAFGYHAISIGNLASELVYRITGSTLREVYERTIRAPLAVDFYLGLPQSEEHRRVDVLPLVAPQSPTPTVLPSVLGPVVFAPPGRPIDFANDPASWKFGHPAASGTGSARGIARLLAAAVTGLEGHDALLHSSTVEAIGQQQVHGYDEVLGQADRAHSIVFQKPTASYRFGGPRAFGHDGAQGCLATVDPDTGLVFAYTVARGPWPGGADPRALEAVARIAAAFALS